MNKYNLFNLLLITLFFVMSNNAFAANLQRTVLYFDKDKSALTTAEKQKIKDVAESDVIFLYGHTDSDGDNAYNLRLSEKRVKEVAKLIASISPDKKLDMQYFGEMEALNANKDEAEKTLNRRVEVVFISDPILSFKTEKQKFTIDNSKDQTITCKEGTVIEIPKGAFENKMIEIEVSEHYKPLEILSENLTTVSDGKPLQTQGMIHIAAFENGKTIQSSKEITYKFPKKDKVNDDYEFFSGVRNSDYEMNWKQQKPTNVTLKNGLSDTSFITALCSASPDIFKETEKNYYKMRDDIMLFKYNDLQLVCLNESKINVIINPGGKIDSIYTNYTVKDKDCDKVLKEYVKKYTSIKFPTKPNKTFSFASYEFNDFLDKEDKTANVKILSKVNTTTSAEDLVAQKNLDIYNQYYLKVQQEAEIERQRILTEMKKQKEKQLTDFEKRLESSTNTKENILDYVNVANVYVTLQSPNLGWVNCDRSIPIDPNAINFSVNLIPDASIKMIVKDQKSYFTGNKITNSKYTFYRIQKNEPVILISTYKKDGKIFLAIAETTTSKDPFNGLQYQEISYSDLKKKLADLKI